MIRRDGKKSIFVRELLSAFTSWSEASFRQRTKDSKYFGKERKRGLCSELQEWNWAGRCAKRARWCGLQFAVRSSRDLWIQIRGDVREFYSRYCLSLTPSVYVITASAAAVSSSTLSHTLILTHIHPLLPQRYQRRPGAGVCPCQKVTGVPIGNPKIKGPLFLLYVMIPCLCLALYKLLTSGFDWKYSNKHNVECEIKFGHDRKIQTCPGVFGIHSIKKYVIFPILGI